MVMVVSELESQDAGYRRAFRAAVKRLTPRALFTSRLRRDAGMQVMLTFDDGPSREVTPRVLDLLDTYGAKAVFFVIGRRARRMPEILKETVRRGHVIGNHSQLHQADYVFGGPRLTLVGYYRDCQRCQTVVARCLGTPPWLFRPPGGHVSPTTLLVPRLLGMRAVGWSVEVGDWGFRSDVQAREGAAKLVARIQPLDIVLLHDDNPSILTLLEDLLPALRARDLYLDRWLPFL